MMFRPKLAVLLVLSLTVVTPRSARALVPPHLDVSHVHTAQQAVSHASLVAFVKQGLHNSQHHQQHLHNPTGALLPFLKQEAQQAFDGYKNQLVTHPLVTKMLTGGTLAVAGDAIAQSQKQDEPYDKKRAASFMAFDMSYRVLQHFSYPLIVAACQGQWLGSVIPHELVQIPQESLSAMEQTLVSQLGIVPFFYYPVFFALTGALQGLTPSESVDRAKETFLPLMRRNLMFWIPVQFAQFGYIDEQLQIPFLSVAGLCWTFILSTVAGSAKQTTAAAAAAAGQTGQPQVTASVASKQLEEQLAVLVEMEDDVITLAEETYATTPMASDTLATNQL